MIIRFQSCTSSFDADQQLVASLVNSVGTMVGLYQADQPVQLKPLCHKKNTPELFYSNSEWLVSDRLELITAGLYRCTREWKNISGQSQEVILVMDLYRPGPVSSYVIPAVSYNGNAWGNGLEPKGLVDSTLSGSSPEAAAWVFGGDRTSIPVCTMTESNNVSVALYTSEALANESARSLHHLPGDWTSQRIWWPLQEQPRTYSGRDVYSPAIHNTILFQAGENHTRECFISIHPAVEGPNDFSAILDTAWSQFYRYVPPKITPEQAWSLSIRFAKETLWEEKDDFKGFILGRVS